MTKNSKSQLTPVDSEITVNNAPVPDSSWSLDQLKELARTEHDAILGYARKTATHTFRLGQALTLAKSMTKHGGWASFLEDVGISVATDNRAQKVFDFFKVIEAVEGLTISEAYEKAGISLGKARIPSDGDSSEQEIVVVGASEPSDDQSEVDSDNDSEDESDNQSGDDFDDESENDSDDESEDDPEGGSNDTDSDVDRPETGDSKNTAKHSVKKRTSKPDPEPSQDSATTEDRFTLRFSEVRTRLGWLATEAPHVNAVGEFLAHLLELTEQSQVLLDAIQDALSHE